jgi:hypothetical protein
MSPVGYELSFYIPQNGILHSRHPETLKSYTDEGILWSSGVLASEFQASASIRKQDATAVCYTS